MILASKAKLAQIDQNPKILIQNKEIKRVDIADYPGITIDESLDWKKQINNLCTIISSAVFSLNQVKYLPQKSRLKYCAAVWRNGEATLKHKVKHKTEHMGILSTDGGNRNHGDCLRVHQLIDQEIAISLQILEWKCTKLPKANVCTFYRTFTRTTLATIPLDFSHFTQIRLLVKKALLLQVVGFGIPFLKMFGPPKQ